MTELASQAHLGATELAQGPDIWMPRRAAYLVEAFQPNLPPVTAAVQPSSS